MKTILDYGAIADGKTDCSPFIERALSEDLRLHFPTGNYLITKPILLPSGAYITADKDAVIKAGDGCFTYKGCHAVITNADHENGNENITIDGGTWDGNNAANPRENWRNGPCQGLLFSFFNAKNITVKNVLAKNSESYHFRFGKTENFLVENIEIYDEKFTMCQDGIHVGGGCKNGIIRNIFAKKGNPNDDLIAFNADDSNFYCQNWGMQDLPISDMLVENVRAEDCWTAVRILSVKTAVKNITIRNLTAGVREMGINFDAGRYSEDPMFKSEDFPRGIGKMENITFENFTLWKTRERNLPLCVLEQNGKSFVIKGFKRDMARDAFPDMPTIRFAHLDDSVITIDGCTRTLPCGEALILNESEINLTMND